MKKNSLKGTKTRQEIADEYSWSVQTLRYKLKINNIFLPKGLITPKWQKVIYDQFGYPQNVNKSDYLNI